MAARLSIMLLAGGIALTLGVRVATATYVLVSQSGGDIRRLEDLNGDGDALDAGENTLWADTSYGIGSLDWNGTNLLAVDTTNDVVRQISDNTGDGDALDVGEDLLWADGFNEIYGLEQAGNNVFVSDFGDNKVYRLRDQTGDGDALDVGERVDYAVGITDPMGMFAQNGNLYVNDSVADTLYRLRDHAGDGDALDVGEVLTYTPASLDGAVHALGDGSGALLVSANDDDAIFRISDTSGDGDALDVGEVLIYANTLIAGGPLTDPVGLTNYGNGMLVVASSSGAVSYIQDVNGDGDALDFGEVLLFAEGLVSPADLVTVPEPGAWIQMVLLTTLIILPRHTKRWSVRH